MCRCPGELPIVPGALSRREGYHRHSEFEYKCGLRDQLGDSVEGYPCAHSEREIVHGAYVRLFRFSLPSSPRNGENHLLTNWMINAAAPDSSARSLDPPYLFATLKPANATRKRGSRSPPAARVTYPSPSHQNVLTIII